MERRRRIAAYGLCYDAAGRILLTRLSVAAMESGRWIPPGGGIHQGEHPARAVVREVEEKTGLAVRVTSLHTVVADVTTVPEVAVHNDRVVYIVEVCGGDLRDELDGTTDRTRWVDPAELSGLPLVPFAAEVLGVPEAAALTAEPVETLQEIASERDEEPSSGLPRGQRFGAYGHVTDPAGRILLTKIGNRYPGAGRWHLPGGGTDFGEQPAAALLRELAEETDQVGVITELMSVSHAHQPRAIGPEGHPIDWHTVRTLYRVRVETPTQPRVTEEAGGSTVAAGWFTLGEADRMPLTDFAARAIAGRLS